MSIPYDDCGLNAEDVAEHFPPAAPRRPAAPEGLLVELMDELSSASKPVILLGPNVDAAGANDYVVQLVKKLAAPVWIAPSAARCSCPARHQVLRGVVPASIQGVTGLLMPHDRIVAIGAPVFRYHEYEPRHHLRINSGLLHLTCDPEEAARAPMGRCHQPRRILAGSA